MRGARLGDRVARLQTADACLEAKAATALVTTIALSGTRFAERSAAAAAVDAGAATPDRRFRWARFAVGIAVPVRRVEVGTGPTVAQVAAALLA
jgi:hypothetical protein